MKIIVACGGTGGHSFPGIAVAEELRSRGHEVTIWSSGRDVESSVMRRWTGEMFATGAKQLRARNALSIIASVFRCRRAMKKAKPDALIAMGSYSSLQPVLAAWWCRVPVYLHEANTVPGKAVEFLSRFAKKVAISFDVTAKYLPNVQTERTGLPVRADIADGKRFPFIPENAFVIMVTGGSQGAHRVNELTSAGIVMMKEELSRRGGGGRPLYVIHQSGMKDEGIVMAAYQKAGQPARVHAFENEMANAFASADIVIARAGASTCFELAICGKPSLLIPLPTAMRNHQHFNADAFAACGAADEGVEGELSPRQICRFLLHKYDHPESLAETSKRILALATPNAAAKVADMIERKL